jgi:2,4-dienoyl-CoA reductase-like NADH-dependent reductase (Old Yellow Enzyme family)
MPNLFSPLKLKAIELKNRIMVSPMCQYSSTDGFANDWHLVHLGSRAIGGASVVMTEATAVSPEGRISPGDLGIWKDEHIEQLVRINRFISEHKAIPGIQLAHAGRKASHSEPWKGNKFLTGAEGGWKTVAPSSIPFSDETDTPLELSDEGIKKIVNDFKSAAARAKEAGFKVIEIHGAHGYLINEFLSPFSNKRTDKYGGSFENRIRFLLETVDAIRNIWNEEFPLFVRLSTTEWKDGGWTIEDSVSLVKILKDKGVDLIDCSSGGNITGVSIPLVPGYQVPLAEKIRKETGILTGAVGLITKSEQAEAIISNRQADMIVIAREMLRDPYFPLRASYELGYDDIGWAKQYLRAKQKKSV